MPRVKKPFGESQPPRRDSIRSYGLWFIIAVAYAIVFFQRLSPPAILDSLMKDLRVTTLHAGFLISSYFYGYTLMQLPAGLFIDRHGIRIAVLISLACSIFGTAAFAYSPDLITASTARALVAVGDAMIYSCLIKAAAHWFSPNKFTLMAALSQISGYLGGLVATIPLILIVSAVGWRTTFASLLPILVIVFLSSLLYLPKENRHQLPVGGAANPGFAWLSLWEAIRKKSTLGSCVVFVGNYVPFLSISGAWGVELLTQGYGLTRDGASEILFVLLLGYSIGTLLSGSLIGSKINRIKKPLTLLAAIRFFTLLAMSPLVSAALPIQAVWLLFGLFGFVGGFTGPLVTASVRWEFTGAFLATAVALHAMAGNLANAVAQPLLGAILDFHQVASTGDIPIYLPAGFNILILCMVGLTVISSLGIKLMADKENRPDRIVSLQDPLSSRC